MIININKLSETATIPTKGSTFAAGYDLYADINDKLLIKQGETILISTGLTMEIPNGYFGAIYARSGLSIKHGLKPANCVGVIDSDYRGEIKVALQNQSNKDYIISPNDRIAQIIFQPYLDVEFNEKELNETDRNIGGFGSTGK